MTWWQISLIIGGGILFICLICFLYICAIAKKDGKVADGAYTEIAFAAQTAAKILVNLSDQDRPVVCQVTRGILGVRIEVSSSGEPPIHYDKEIRTDGRPEEEIRKMCLYAADSIVHFTKDRFLAAREYGDTYRIQKNLYYRPPQRPV